MKKITAVILVMIVLATSLSLSASAATFSVCDEGGGHLDNGLFGDYSEKWEIKQYFDSDYGLMVFGFDTAGIGNKDYCSVFHMTKAHRASVSNSVEEAVISDSAGAASYTDKVKVEHAARPVWTAIY